MKAFSSIANTSRIITNEGMDLRDYFAAKAMQSIILREGKEALVIDDITFTAYQYADAMMKAREQ